VRICALRSARDRGRRGSLRRGRWLAPASMVTPEYEQRSAKSTAHVDASACERLASSSVWARAPPSWWPRSARWSSGATLAGGGRVERAGLPACAARSCPSQGGAAESTSPPARSANPDRPRRGPEVLMTNARFLPAFTSSVGPRGAPPPPRAPWTSGELGASDPSAINASWPRRRGGQQAALACGAIRPRSFCGRWTIRAAAWTSWAG